ncbi:MAG TPA: hypothetical protein VMA74_10900, partial [Dyella sp.]|uniref:hypothetical protein n=1 Tax=Dyella sp. TaxID=1869338 RepID=UPI002D178D05
PWRSEVGKAVVECVAYATAVGKANTAAAVAAPMSCARRRSSIIEKASSVISGLGPVVDSVSTPGKRVAMRGCKRVIA